MKKCNGTSYDIDHCREEKMGCKGCYYDKENDKYKQKIIKRIETKSISNKFLLKGGE